MWLLLAAVVLGPALLVVLFGALRAGSREDELAERYHRDGGQ